MEDVKPSRSWTFESPTDVELERRDWQTRLMGRWTFLDADSADPESLDDGPRPGDAAQGVKR